MSYYIPKNLKVETIGSGPGRRATITGPKRTRHGQYYYVELREKAGNNPVAGGTRGTKREARQYAESWCNHDW